MRAAAFGKRRLRTDAQRARKRAHDVICASCSRCARSVASSGSFVVSPNPTTPTALVAGGPESHFIGKALRDAEPHLSCLRGDQPAEHVTHVGHARVHVDHARLHHLRPAEGERLLRQARRALSGLDDFNVGAALA